MNTGSPTRKKDFPQRRDIRCPRWKRAAILTFLLALGGASTLHLIGNRPVGHAVRAWSQPQLADLRYAEHCDVLVVGATPSGIAAAVGAARQGASVVLVEERARVGGDITYAMLNMFDVPMAPRGKSCPVAYGVFGELYQELGTAFDLKRGEKAMLKLLSSHPNISLRTSTAITRLYLSSSQLAGVKLRGSGGSESTISCATTVDATNDAVIAAQAGAGYYVGRENANPDKRMQAAGLLFSVRDIDWRKVRAYVRGSRVVPMTELAAKKGLRNSIDARPLTATSPPPGTSRKTARIGAIAATDREQEGEVVLRHGGMAGNYAWERGDVVKDYVPRGPHMMALSINFGRQDDGSVVLNTLNIVGVNGLSHASKQAAYQEASREIPHLVEYLRHRMPGFKNAKLAQIAPELYIRETRHIHGYYSLKARDVSQETRFDDRVALCSYPLDLHPYKLHDVNPFGPRRYYYTIPLRSLVPRRVDGVFVASRSLSATYSAAGSARVIPPTMAAGEAAGVAAALCQREGITPHQMMDNSYWVRELQEDLRDSLFDVGDKFPSYKAPDSTRSTLANATRDRSVAAVPALSLVPRSR